MPPPLRNSTGCRLTGRQLCWAAPPSHLPSCKATCLWCNPSTHLPLIGKNTLLRICTNGKKFISNYTLHFWPFLKKLLKQKKCSNMKLCLLFYHKKNSLYNYFLTESFHAFILINFWNFRQLSFPFPRYTTQKFCKVFFIHLMPIWPTTLVPAYIFL